MAKRQFQRFLPSKARLQQPRSKWLTRALNDPNAWHWNRHRVTRGMAVGLFWAWMPIPLPSLWAALTAWKLRGNVPLAFACCWLRNPLTLIPAIWLSHLIGSWIIPPSYKVDWPTAWQTFQTLPSDGWWQKSSAFLHAFWNNMGLFYPILVGSITLGCASATGCYLIVRILWRWSIALRWAKRNRDPR